MSTPSVFAQGPQPVPANPPVELSQMKKYFEKITKVKQALAQQFLDQYAVDVSAAAAAADDKTAVNIANIVVARVKADKEFLYTLGKEKKDDKSFVDAEWAKVQEWIDANESREEVQKMAEDLSKSPIVTMLTQQKVHLRQVINDNNLAGTKTADILLEEMMYTNDETGPSIQDLRPQKEKEVDEEVESPRKRRR
jgi:hypothetical protein